MVVATRVYLVLARLTLRRWLWWHVPRYSGRVVTHDKRDSAEDVRNARQAAMSQTTQQWQERVNEMQQQITILRGRVDVSQAAARQLTPTSVFDTRVLGKPDCFDCGSRWKDSEAMRLLARHLWEYSWSVPRTQPVSMCPLRAARQTTLSSAQVHARDDV